MTQFCWLTILLIIYYQEFFTFKNLGNVFDSANRAAIKIVVQPLSMGGADSL